MKFYLELRENLFVMVTKVNIRKMGLFFIVPVLAVFTALYSSDLFICGSIESPHHAVILHDFDLYPWGVIQFVVAFVYWYLILQVSVRSRWFAICAFLPLLMELTFSGYLLRQYPGVEYATVVQASLCTSFEQMGTYADVRLFFEWGVEIVAVLLYVIFFYKRLWRESRPHGGWWFVALCVMVVCSYFWHLFNFVGKNIA